MRLKVLFRAIGLKLSAAQVRQPPRGSFSCRAKASGFSGLCPIYSFFLIGANATDDWPFARVTGTNSPRAIGWRCN